MVKNLSLVPNVVQRLTQDFSFRAITLIALNYILAAILDRPASRTLAIASPQQTDPPPKDPSSFPLTICPPPARIHTFIQRPFESALQAYEEKGGRQVGPTSIRGSTPELQLRQAHFNSSARSNAGLHRFPRN